MRVWGKGKPVTENSWKIKINRFTEKNQFSIMVLSCKLTISFMPTEKRV